MVERAIRLYGCAIFMVLMIGQSYSKRTTLYCDPGSYTKTTRDGTEMCVPCARGSYSLGGETGSERCTSCPEGTSTENNGATSSEQCNVCAAGYRGKNRGRLRAGRVPCIICPIGTYSKHKSRYCFKCPKGETTRIRGATHCERSTTPFCDPGTYTNTTHDGIDMCVPCARGSYSLGGERATCKRCASTGNGHFVVPYTTRDEGATSENACIPNCAAGEYFIDGFTFGGICFWCNVGSYSTGGAARKCTRCGGGTYQPNRRATGCILCPAGSYSRYGTVYSCSLCGNGFYQDKAGQTTCKRCEVGTITTQPGGTSGWIKCLTCPPGTTTRGISDNTCRLICTPGQRGPLGLAPCTPCERGKYAASERTFQCTACPKGTSTESSGMSSCNVCAAGYRGKNTSRLRAGRVPCVICPIGTYSRQQARICTLCPRGTTTRISGATKCDFG